MCSKPAPAGGSDGYPRLLQKTAVREQPTIRTNFDAAWRLTCLITSGWIAPDGVTSTGRAHLDMLAREVGVIS